MASLLPPNSTATEIAFAEAISRVSDVPVPLDTIWNVDTCPAALLPWLAWSLSVDQWDESWSEERKRDVIRQSVWIHRHKGTRGAVERALSVLGYSVQIVEWWETTPRGEPYTFALNVDVDDRGINDSVSAEILTAVNRSKNVRSHLSSMTINSVTVGRCKIAAAAMIGSTITVFPYTPDDITIQSKHIYGGAMTQHTTITLGVLSE